MTERFASIVVMLGVAASISPASGPHRRAEASGEPPIEVLSFNIRHDNPGDGAHRWPHRADAALATILELAPDFVGLQEVLPDQRAWIDRSLSISEPAWASLGRSRERSADTGEATPLLHRTDRWTRLEGGTFWLSETPEDVGSRSWGSACPRIATWGLYRRRPAEDRTDAPVARPLLVVNTHLDHASAEARQGGVEVLSAFIESRRRLDPSIAVVVMGDFNASPDSAPVRTLLAAGLVDTHRAAGGGEQLGTYHGFEGQAVALRRPRIDFVLADKRLEVLAAEIVLGTPDILVSDHYPVRATLGATLGADSTESSSESTPETKE